MSCRRLICAITGTCAIQIALYAQEKTDGLPVTLEVATGKVYADGAVCLQGITTSLDNNPGFVAIEIKKPDNTVDKLSVRADKTNGKFLARYIPKAVGVYEATAFSPDRLQTATAEFEVELNWDEPGEMETAQKEAESTITSIESFAQNIVSEKLLTSSETNTLKEKINKAKEKISGYTASLTQLQQGYQYSREIIDRYPEFGQYIHMPEKAGSINSYLKEQNSELQNIRENISSQKLKGSDICGRLHALSEACALFSTLMNVKSTSIVSIIKNIAIDKAWPQFYDKYLAPKKLMDDNDNFLAKQAGKAFASAEMKLSNLASFDYGAGVMGDLTQYVSDQVFKKFCSEYSGMLEGEYALEFKNNGKRYMYYKYKYVGKISLMARKEAMQKEGTNFSGYLEGNINAVDFDDDVWAVEDKSQWQQEYYRRLKMIVVPVNLNGSDPGFGAIARQGMPGAFYFPLKGKIVQGKMVIELQPAMMELSETNTNRTAIIVSDPNNVFNRRGVLFTYPSTKAWFIITRSLRMTDKNPKTTLEIKKDASGNSIEADLSRTEAPADTKVDFKLKFKLKQD